MSLPRIKVLGVPLDLGAGHRGVDMGPSAIRVAGLLDGLRALGYDVAGPRQRPRPDAGLAQARRSEGALPEGDRARRAPRSRRSSSPELDENTRPVILGGDHSLAIGSVAGVAGFWRKRGEKVGMIWVDAHTDMNTPETTETRQHPRDAARDAARDGAARARRASAASSRRSFPRTRRSSASGASTGSSASSCSESGVTVFTMRDVDEKGLRNCMERALEIANRGTAGFQLSYDVDGVDAFEAPGVGTPVRGGLTYREAHLVAEMAYDSKRLLGMDITEVNPVEDERNQTARLAAELVFSAFGRQIL